LQKPEAIAKEGESGMFCDWLALMRFAALLGYGRFAGQWHAPHKHIDGAQAMSTYLFTLVLYNSCLCPGAGAGPCRLFGEANRFVLGDTYHEPHKLYVWDLYRSEVATVALLAPANWPGPAYARATLNPHWSPNGRSPALSKPSHQQASSVPRCSSSADASRTLPIEALMRATEVFGASLDCQLRPLEQNCAPD